MENKKTAIIISVFAISLFLVVIAFFMHKKNIDNNVSQNNGYKVDQNISSNLKNNNFDEALVQVDNLLSKKPNDIELLLLKAEILLTKGSFQFTEEINALKAQEIIQGVLERDANNVKAYKLLGYSYEIQNMFDKALVNYDKSLSIEETSDAYNWKGHTYDLMGDTVKAEEFYKKAFELDTNNRMAARNLASIYARMGENDKARKILEELMVMPVDNISAVAGDYHSLGNIEFSEQKIDLAEKTFNKALNVDESFMLAQVELAKIKILFRGELDEAINDLNKISTDNPKQVFPVEWLGFAYLESDKLNESIEQFNKGLELVETDITLMPLQRTIVRSRLNYYLSISYALNGDAEKSKIHLLKTMEGMDETTMTMLVGALQSGENGPYKNIIHDQDIINLINELNNLNN